MRTARPVRTTEKLSFRRNASRLLAASLLLEARLLLGLSQDFDQFKAPPPPPVVKCALNQSDLTVTTFGGIFGYQFKGSCTVTFPGTGVPPLPAGQYSASGSWTESTGMVNELLKGTDRKGQPWELMLGGNCHLDPWMTGNKGAGCHGSLGTHSPNAPTALSIQKLGFPISAGLLDGQALGWLTGKAIAALIAEDQAPKIVAPAEDSSHSGDLTLTIHAGPGSPTKDFALEWEEKVGASWVKRSYVDTVGPDTTVKKSTFGDGGTFHVRARAHQRPKANWSDWRTFKIAAPAPACQTTGMYGASYDVSATPATMTAGQTKNVSIKVQNLGTATWPANGNFHLSYHWLQNGAPVVYDGIRTVLPSNVPSCGQITVGASLQAPPAAGTYTLQWDMVNENVTWFSTQGVPTGNKVITVQ